MTNRKCVSGVLAAALIFGFVLAGRVDAAPAAVPKTIIITGFNMPLEGTVLIELELTGDWDDERGGWIKPACSKAEVDGKPSLILEGQRITVPLWNKDSNELTRWTGTGKYGINVNIYPNTKDHRGTVKTYRYRHKTNNAWVAIKNAETTIKWSDFVFGWDWEN